jgi:hypothetical protein
MSSNHGPTIKQNHQTPPSRGLPQAEEGTSQARRNPPEGNSEEGSFEIRKCYHPAEASRKKGSQEGREESSQESSGQESCKKSDRKTSAISRNRERNTRKSPTAEKPDHSLKTVPFAPDPKKNRSWLLLFGCVRQQQ